MNKTTMRCSVLASGSTGNAVYVEAGDTRILVDAGIGWRQLDGALKGISVAGVDLDALLVTHEHSDHIKSVGSIVKKWKLPVYTSEGTWSHLSKLFLEDDPVLPRTIRSGTPFSLGEIVVEPFSLSHDAEEPLGFCFYSGEEKMVLATDLGYVSDKIKSMTKGAHTYIIETNHDVEMLRAGPYPWHLKRRILGDKGHLSNGSAAEYLQDVITEQTEHVYLAHLSEHNNRPDLARETLSQALSSHQYPFYERVSLHHTSPKQATELRSVREAQ